MLLLLMPAPALSRFDPNIVLQKYYDTFKMWFMFMTLYDFLAKMTLKTTLKLSKATVFWNGIHTDQNVILQKGEESGSIGLETLSAACTKSAKAILL